MKNESKYIPKTKKNTCIHHITYHRLINKNSNQSIALIQRAQMTHFTPQKNTNIVKCDWLCVYVNFLWMIPFDVWLEIDSGIGRATPPRRAPSPGMHTLNRHMPSPSGPGSLPPGLITKRRGMDDGSSDMSSTGNLMMDYSGSYAKFSNLYHQIYYFIIYQKSNHIHC